MRWLAADPEERRIFVLDRPGKPDDPVGQFVQTARHLPGVNRIDRNRLDAAADRFNPLGRDAAFSEHNAENRTGGSAGAISIVAAIYRITDAAAEITFPVKQTKNRKADIGRSLEPAEVITVLDDGVSGVFERSVFFRKVHRQV